MSKTVSAALAQKLSAGQQGTGNKSRALLRALRLALARCAIERVQLSVSVIGAKQSIKKQELVTNGMEEGRLFLLFSARDGRVACISLDTGFVSAIIQKQTIGEVFSEPSPPRSLTDTDAAMVVPLVEDVLVTAIRLVDQPANMAHLSGYEFASRANDLRALSLALVEDVYDAFELTVELEGGIRQGAVSVLFPQVSRLENGAGQDNTEQDKTLAEAIGVVRAELNAVVCRMHLPLSELSELRVGDALPLSGARLDKIDVATIDRAQATKGKLGQCGGLRAVRINEKPLAPSPVGATEKEFVGHKPKENSEDAQDYGGADRGSSGLSEAESLAETFDLDAKAEELSLISTDRIATEITELAGLPAPDRIPSP